MDIKVKVGLLSMWEEKTGENILTSKVGMNMTTCLKDIHI